MAISLEFLSDLHPDEMEDVLRKMSKEPNDYVPLTINQHVYLVHPQVEELVDSLYRELEEMKGFRGK